MRCLGRARRRVCFFFLALSGSACFGGCSNDAGGGASPAGGGTSAASAGTSGTSGAGGGGASSGTGPMSGAGGSSGGGMAGNGAGASSGGAAGGGAAGASAGGGAGGQGGMPSCAGNAISLSANGTGSDSDAAKARVIIDLASDLPLGNANRTIEFWADIKPSDWLGEKNELYVYGDFGVNAGGFGLDFGTFAVTGMPDNHATLNPITGGGFNDDSRNDLGVSSGLRQWLHIAMTWNGNVIKTYVNGALKITSPGTGGASMLSTASSPISLGCNPVNNGCFNGSFDELRVWNIARSDADIAANYNKNVATDAPNLVGYWKFDEQPGASTAADSVTSAGHTAHPGLLMAAMPAGLPTFVTPASPAPIHCR